MIDLTKGVTKASGKISRRLTRGPKNWIDSSYHNKEIHWWRLYFGVAFLLLLRKPAKINWMKLSASNNAPLYPRTQCPSVPQNSMPLCAPELNAPLCPRTQCPSTRDITERLVEAKLVRRADSGTRKALIFWRWQKHRFWILGLHFFRRRHQIF